ITAETLGVSSQSRWSAPASDQSKQGELQSPIGHEKVCLAPANHSRDAMSLPPITAPHSCLRSNESTTEQVSNSHQLQCSTPTPNQSQQKQVSISRQSQCSTAASDQSQKSIRLPPTTVQHTCLPLITAERVSIFHQSQCSSPASDQSQQSICLPPVTARRTCLPPITAEPVPVSHQSQYSSPACDQSQQSEYPSPTNHSAAHLPVTNQSRAVRAGLVPFL
uniref:Uncharacterized protein n=1 Tax=Apteryx owenii TaxID=8824 RepID=A0A8B9QAC9_APTOW